MKKREKELGEKMKASLEAFYNNQFRRDEEVLTILRKRGAIQGVWEVDGER